MFPNLNGLSKENLIFIEFTLVLKDFRFYLCCIVVGIFICSCGASFLLEVRGYRNFDNRLRLELN